MNSKKHMLELFNVCRKKSVEICSDLEIEDYSVQPTIDVSPPKWHLAHTTWFFEQFVLCEYLSDYKVFDNDFAYLFNSYYNNAGARVLRPNRGLMTRPIVSKVLEYRAYVDQNIQRLIEVLDQSEVKNSRISYLIETGINHEQQHQELLVYDIKYILGHQPIFPNIKLDLQLKNIENQSDWISIDEGLYIIGHDAKTFCFDNEGGQHKVYLNNYAISNQLVTNKQWIDFMEAGGYANFNLWHADGWQFINDQNISAPMYWHKIDDEWLSYSFNGLEKVDLDAPVAHISYYEAFAFAEWSGCRLPTEFEWEVAQSKFTWGQVWEWTGSAYLPYPGFVKEPGALGEYNGKFMVNQHVLRGASIATSIGHSRHTYRNFFAPHLRWMYSGLRLAK